MSVFQSVFRRWRILRLWLYLWLRRVNASFPVYYTGSLPNIIGGRRITIGRRVWFIGNDGRSARIEASNSGTVELGESTLINNAVQIYSEVRVHIGANTLIAELCTIQDTNFHQVDEESNVRRGPVFIGRNVWLGRNVHVLPGSIIGDHSVIASGSVVNGEIPPKSLAGGSPARVIRRIIASDAFKRR